MIGPFPAACSVIAASILIGWQTGRHASIENIDNSCSLASFGLRLVGLFEPLDDEACNIDERGVVNVLCAGRESREARSAMSASAFVLLLRLTPGGADGGKKIVLVLPGPAHDGAPLFCGPST